LQPITNYRILIDRSLSDNQLDLNVTPGTVEWTPRF
jgi:hypothetical protein